MIVTKEQDAMVRGLTAAAAIALIFGSAASGMAQEAVADKTAKRAEALNKRFDRTDRNRDGVVDRAEVELPGLRMFDRADANRDGIVDAEEVKALSDKRAERVRKRLDQADKNRDGAISKDEFLVSPPWFTRADENRDGKVSKDELATLADKAPRARTKDGAN